MVIGLGERLYRHLGYPTLEHTPEARGFNEYLGYLTGAEDYWTHIKTPVPSCGPTKDLWRGASLSNGTVTISRPADEPEYFPEYSIFIFNAFLQEKIAAFASKYRQTNEETGRLFIYAVCACPFQFARAHHL